MGSQGSVPAVFPGCLALEFGETSNDELEARLRRFARVEREALALLLVHLAEFDRRRLYADRGYPSLFAYCTSVLGHSEQGAYKRIQAARAARKHPLILARLASGEINLSAVVVLAPHLMPGSAEELLDAARGKSTWELRRFAACLCPRPDAPDRLLMLPGPSHGADASPRELLDPLSGERFLFRFSGGEGLRAKYQKARELLRVDPADGAMGIVFERGLDALLERVDPARRRARRAVRRASPSGDGSSTRAIPRSVRDAVWERDGGRCVFVGPEGARCGATAWLELDHIIPHALGGGSDDARNLRLMCRAHNLLLARRVFGDRPAGEWRRRRRASGGGAGSGAG